MMQKVIFHDPNAFGSRLSCSVVMKNSFKTADVTRTGVCLLNYDVKVDIFALHDECAVVPI